MPAGAVDEIRQHDLVAFRTALSGKTPPRHEMGGQTVPAGARPSPAPRRGPGRGGSGNTTPAPTASRRRPGSAARGGPRSPKK
jgi:23S rRNA pseudouridine2605 synthase